MGMILQEAEIRNYRLFVFHRPEDGKWEFWIRKNKSLVAQAIGSDSCTDTKLLAQNHLYQLLMNRTEKKHFNPVKLLDWTYRPVTVQRGSLRLETETLPIIPTL